MGSGKARSSKGRIIAAEVKLRKKGQLAPDEEMGTAARKAVRVWAVGIWMKRCVS